MPSWRHRRPATKSWRASRSSSAPPTSSRASFTWPSTPARARSPRPSKRGTTTWWCWERKTGPSNTGCSSATRTNGSFARRGCRCWSSSPTWPAWPARPMPDAPPIDAPPGERYGRAPLPAEIAHIEFKSANFARTSEFYAKLFDWQMEQNASASYMKLAGGNGPSAGWFRADLVQAPGPVAYLPVEDLEAKLTEIEAAGGRILVRSLPFAGGGEIGLFADPDGNGA